MIPLPPADSYRDEIMVEVIPHSGMLELSYIDDDGNYFRQRYIGYTKRQALTLFELYVSEQHYIIEEKTS